MNKKIHFGYFRSVFSILVNLVSQNDVHYYPKSVRDKGEAARLLIMKVATQLNREKLRTA